MVTFEEFKSSWLEDIQNGNPSTVELGRRFARKLISHWLDCSDMATDFYDCDGSGDGGIDIAFLDTGNDDAPESAESVGHTWYLVQSKYGTAFSGTKTLLAEGLKVIETLDRTRTHLNSLSESIVEKVTHFRHGASPSDKIVLMYATESSLNDDEKTILTDLRTLGRERLGAIFDIESISIETIFDQLQEREITNANKRLQVELKANLTLSAPNLLVGSIGLLKLYDFLKQYRDKTGDLDRIYEKNVRRFLGGRGKVNKVMQETLRKSPEVFGLYNNGITIVVQDFRTISDSDGVILVEPFIVNGCQTTRSIWEVTHNRLDAGGTGVNPEIEDWKKKAAQGVVIAKIVKVGTRGDSFLQDITRYTNSQNAIREKDFLALANDFKVWQEQMSNNYSVYLEIQRGGWDSQKALQNTDPSSKRFVEHTNAADLLKIYGAGWLKEAGTAFGKNPPFLPDGSIFKRIMNDAENDSGPFGVLDLYAAYLLEKYTEPLKFGRSAEKVSRRQTRFLFLMIVIDLLRGILIRAQLSSDNRAISGALISILNNEESREYLLDMAIQAIDEYMTEGTDSNIFMEPKLKQRFNTDLNAFLKWEKLGKSADDTPILIELITGYKRMMVSKRGGVCPHDVIVSMINVH